MNKGIFYTAAAYLLWGFLPVYWKALIDVPAAQILAHRIVWSLVFLAALITWKRNWGSLRRAVKTSKTALIVLASSGLILVNWGTYIWAVNAGYIVETSLGYFINPLVSVVLGVVLLKENLRPAQWIPVGLALFGVLYLTIGYGQLPWISLVLAFSFGLYGLVKKTAPLEALHGLTLETAVLSIPCGLFLLFLGFQGDGSFLESGLRTDILLILTGVVTSSPLLLFGMGARLIPLVTVGLLQYIAPTCQFLLGVLVYNEPLTMERLVGFCIIWLALIIYTLEGLLARRRSAASPIV